MRDRLPRIFEADFFFFLLLSLQPPKMFVSQLEERTALIKQIQGDPVQEAVRLSSSGSCRLVRVPDVCAIYVHRSSQWPLHSMSAALVQ